MSELYRDSLDATGEAMVTPLAVQLDVSLDNDVYRLSMPPSPLARFGFLAAFLSIAALASLTLSPTVALAHHHVNESGLGENTGNSSEGAVEQDCSLCLSISLNDGNALDESPCRVPENSVSSPAQAPSGVWSPIAAPSCSLPIRGPPANA